MAANKNISLGQKKTYIQQDILQNYFDKQGILFIHLFIQSVHIFHRAEIIESELFFKTC